ncbi:DMT family transporter [Paenibacillus allorhizosphaerae]|uniref:EamA domain-containing protein n=1 Tax=Paenibacillus allorhizosphaerae TaxID=2849866 RepID=A0ABM8VPQ4_9BACL|nr:DMT family transporter [Paenibacillus allorhizosphaerae]CAG7653200.1 hypothetical protein PAECIP111802_05425 [Paenibacillus allorhizosphaerae]
MGYVLLLLATLSWSFVGILVKTASSMVDSTTITFLRFFLGIVCLGLFLWVKNRKVLLRYDLRWIWLGALGKSCNYFFENLALSIGYSYGNILVGPIQTVILLLISAFWLKESVSAKGWTAAALCIGGVLIISWNGMPLSVLASGGALTTLLFALSAFGSSFHVLSQKVLIKEMDAGNMNFSVFVWCSVLMALPLPARAHWTGDIHMPAVLALLALGLITGLSFYWFSQALQRVSFPVAVIVSNSGVLFTILWSYLFFHDPITVYILVGAAVFMIGLVLLNLPVRRTVRMKEGLSSHGEQV